MSFFGPVWSSLKFSSVSAGSQLVSSLNYRIQQDKSDLVYKNNRYKSVLVHTAKQLVMSELEGQLNQILPRFRRNTENELRETVLKQQEANRAKIIENGKIQAENWGTVDAEGGNKIIAKDRFGTAVPEALMVYYDDEESHQVEDISYVGGKEVKTSYSTKTVCHIDLSPQVSMNSSKNIVMTQVQGRDYTRKELVSGGDLQFTVNGVIVGNEDGVYPDVAVKKFIQIMQYNGILNVNFMLFGQFNVNRIIVTNYSLGAVEMKNVQPYSFSCVAVEPDEDVKITKDTIGAINTALELSPMNKWYKFILETKLGEILSSAVMNTATSVATQGAGMGLDALAPNI